VSKTRHREQTKHHNARRPGGGGKLASTKNSAIAKTQLGAAVASAPESVLSRPQVKSAAVSRRTFLNLLTGLPLIGRVLGLGRSIASFAFLPPGFLRWETCGEYNGSTDKGNLGPGKERQRTGTIVTVSCLCHGIPCKYCGKLKHRPISNSYDPQTNTVWHTPYFAGLFGCAECEAKRRAAR
jgi:hypothetical protein